MNNFRSPFKKADSNQNKQQQLPPGESLFSRNRVYVPPKKDDSSQDQRQNSHMPITNKQIISKQPQKQKQPTQLQLKLDRILNQSAQRQQKYVAFIKEQQQQIFGKTQKYLQSLKKYKEYIQEKFNQVRNPKKYQNYQKSMANSYLSQKNSKVVNKFNKQQYDQSKNSNYQLHCALTFIYFSPLLQDYMSQLYPKKILIKSRIQYPGIDIKLQCDVVTSDGTDQQILQNLINGYPFQLIDQSRKNPMKEFIIRGDHQISSILNYFNFCQICIDIVDKQNQFVYCRGKLPLKQLLYYSNSRQQSMQKISFFCLKTNKKIAFLHIQFSNQVRIIDKNQIHKVQSQTPIQIKQYEFKNKFKNDIQSRIIQRINRFKTNNSTLIPEMHANDNRVDTSLLMHVKKKELENIMQYKSTHKQEYMQHVLNQALEKFNTQVCELGQCKYLLVRFMNDSNKVRKITIEAMENKMNNDGKQNIQDSKQSVWKFIPPETIKEMIQKASNQVRAFKSYEFQYEYQESQRAIWVGAGDSIALCYKFLEIRGDISTKNISEKSQESQSLKPLLLETQIKSKNILNFIYQLNVNFSTQYGQKISSEILKVRLRQPVSQHTFQLNGNPGDVEQLDISITDQNCSQIHSTLRNLQFAWTKNNQFLNLKLKHPPILNDENATNKVEYLFLYDSKFISRRACFKLIMNTFPIVKTRNLLFGQVGMFQLQMKGVDLCKNYQKQIKLKKGQFAPDSFRIRVATDRGHQAIADWHGNNQFITKKGQTYLIDIRVQTFQSFNPFKVMINCIDCNTQKVLKRFLLKIPIQFPPYKNQYKIYLSPQNPKTPYKFQLSNLKSSQSQFRMYSSNKSILKVPRSLIKLFGNQVLDVQLNFQVEKRGSNSFTINGQDLFIILSVTDGSDFWNYLFEIEGLK